MGIKECGRVEVEEAFTLLVFRLVDFHQLEEGSVLASISKLEGSGPMNSLKSPFMDPT
jgi:hypothetical protein